MASMPDRTIKEQEKPSKYRWYVLGLLTLTSMFSVADRLVFSILMEDIKAEFSFSDLELGLLGGLAFSATYVIAGLPAARLADHSSSNKFLERNDSALWLSDWFLVAILSAHWGRCGRRM
jgi:sugar phosphate permease